MENIDATPKTFNECRVLCARACFIDQTADRWAKRMRWAVISDSVDVGGFLWVHHCLPFLYLFLIPLQATAQSPREISHPAQCDEGNACVCVRAWKQDESKRQGERAKLFSILGLRIPLCIWKVNLGWKKGIGLAGNFPRKSTKSIWAWLKSDCSIISDWPPRVTFGSVRSLKF